MVALHLRFENPFMKFCSFFTSLFTSKVALEQNVFDFEHGYANRMDICDLTLMIFAYVLFPFHKCVRESSAISNTLLS